MAQVTTWKSQHITVAISNGVFVIYDKGNGDCMRGICGGHAIDPGYFVECCDSEGYAKKKLDLSHKLEL
ncbi:hypothetical protein E3Q09_03427 [Wallemia mellicola]|nr:hypothetical protein E3Q09_03427 [Wallemia mellicola]